MIVRLYCQRNPGLPGGRKVSMIFSGAMHDPVYNKVEKKCIHYTPLSDTSVNFK